MAVGISDALSSRAFDRHIKRLVWCALLGSIALLLPLARSSFSPDIGLTQALGAIVVVVAVLSVVRDVGRYVRNETIRRREAIKASRLAGACQVADAIQDRVANLLSVTVGYVDFLAEDEDLPMESREHAQRALDSALAATRVVSGVRQSLRCHSQTPSGSSRLEMLQRDAQSRARDSRNARLIAEAPAVFDVLDEAQRLAIDVLAAGPRWQVEEDRVRQLLERINQVTQRLEP